MDHHINQQLKIIHDELTVTQRSQTLVPDVFFITTLLALYQRRSTLNYKTEDIAWIRDWGDAFAAGRQQMMLSVANVGGNHWISFVIDARDPKNPAILVGDSNGVGVESEVAICLQWWLGEHRLSYPVCELTSEKQNDSFSCGVFALNALQHYVNPSISLVRPSVLAVRDKRVEMFKKVVDRSMRSFWVCTE